MKSRPVTSLLDAVVFKQKKQSRLRQISGNKYLLIFTPFVLFFAFGIALITFSIFLFNKKGTVLSAISPTPVYNVYNSNPNVPNELDMQIETVDARSQKLEAFFNKYGAPLAPYSDFIIQMADKYEIDWKLVSAIGYCEGNGGKKIPEGSFNTWGWGASEADLATKSGKYNLGSWETAIETVSKGLKKGYIDKGLDTPFEIMLKYAPQSINNGGSWAKCVESYMHEIDNIK